jgi:hypothetical protein
VSYEVAGDNNVLGSSVGAEGLVATRATYPCVD